MKAINLRKSKISGFISTVSVGVEKLAKQRFSSDLERFRPGSFPLISADTFRSLANRIIDEGSFTVRQRFCQADITFLDMRYFQHGPSDVDLGEIPGLAEIMHLKVHRPKVLIIANADLPPTREQREILANSFDAVYCTNISREMPRVFAIPVGIENLYRLNNGLPWGFLNAGELSAGGERNESVFSCFSVSTNRESRIPARNAVLASRHQFHAGRLAPSQFQSRVMKAKFVISPPGNGSDCHRTWEAIYLGAVPVVLKGTLAKQMVRQLPILEVNDYSEFLGLSEEQLTRVFAEQKAKSTEMAFMPYWVSRICYGNTGTSN